MRPIDSPPAHGLSQLSEISPRAGFGGRTEHASEEDFGGQTQRATELRLGHPLARQELLEARRVLSAQAGPDERWLVLLPAPELLGGSRHPN